MCYCSTHIHTHKHTFCPQHEFFAMICLVIPALMCCWNVVKPYDPMDLCLKQNQTKQKTKKNGKKMKKCQMVFGNGEKDITIYSIMSHVEKSLIIFPNPNQCPTNEREKHSFQSISAGWITLYGSSWCVISMRVPNQTEPEQQQTDEKKKTRRKRIKSKS